MNHTLRLFTATVFCSSCMLFAASTPDTAVAPQTSDAAGAVNPTGTPVRPAVKPEIDKDELLGHIKFLSSPELHGREAGSPDQLKVAAYIADEFTRYGLEPYGDEKDGKRGFLQEFPIIVFDGLGKTSEFSFTVGGQKTSAELRKQFLPIPAGYQQITKADAGVVFAGYGIMAPEFNYDDFANLNLSGKWALILRYEPRAFATGKMVPGRDFSKYAGMANKVLNCSLRRAAGVLVVTGPLGREKEKDEEQLGKNLGGIIGEFNIPVIQITRAVADRILASSGKHVADLQTAIEHDLSNQSFAVEDAHVSAVSDIHVERKLTDNVIGRIAGSDEKLKNEFVVLGAHCDHVGLGYEGSLLGKDGAGKIHPGADDNASGTSGMLEIAQYVSSLKNEQRPKRSVLFIAFSGEEKGLKGSEYFAEHPKVPLKDIDAMLNLDMIGRSSDGGVQVSGIRSSAGFKDLVNGAATDSHLTVHLGGAGDGPSDHATFFHRKIPVLFFYTGTHADYHRPTDTWDKINAPVAAETARLAAKILLDLAGRADRPVFTPVAPGAFMGVSPDQQKVKSARGYPVAEISPGSPAEESGLRKGDLIVGLNGQELTSTLDLLMGLAEYSPGDIVDLKIKRGNETVNVKVTLRGRKPRN